MRFISHAYTDIGIKKNVNQDSALVMEAKTDNENIMFCVLCDGMGGLDSGELASAVVIKAFASWFEEKFPIMYYNRFDSKMLEKVWADLLFEQNIKLMTYSRSKSSNMGANSSDNHKILGKQACEYQKNRQNLQKSAIW